MNLALFNNPDRRVTIESSLAWILSKWPARVLNAAEISIVALFTGFLMPSSEQLKQEQPQPIKPEQKTTADIMPHYVEIGEASWYGPNFQGLETASGETFDPQKMTAAHPSLPLGTKVEVTNLEQNKTVEVKINDRGPYAKNRAIDISLVAAKKLGIVKKGTAKVKIVAKSVKKKISRKKPSKKGIISKKQTPHTRTAK